MGRKHERFVNNAQSPLDGSITSGALTLAVDSATAFPTDGQFRVIADGEIMLVTAVSSNTFTVTRGVEGTAAASHDDDVLVTHLLTAESIVNIFMDLGLSNCLGDRRPTTPGTYDEEFDGTADTLPTNWAWTVAPSGSDGWKLNSDWPSMLAVFGTGNTTSYVLTRSSFAATGDFGLWMKIYSGGKASSDNSNVQIRIGNSTYSETKGWQFRANGVDDVIIRWVENKSGAGLGVAFSNLARGLSRGQNFAYIGLTRSSGNVWKPWYSLDGVAWDHAGLSTDTHSFTPDKLEITFGTEANYTLQAIDWIRYRADLIPPKI